MLEQGRQTLDGENEVFVGRQSRDREIEKGTGGGKTRGRKREEEGGRGRGKQRGKHTIA